MSSVAPIVLPDEFNAASYFVDRHIEEGRAKIGAVPVPVNTLLKSADYGYLLNNSRARVAIVSDSLLAGIERSPDGNCAISKLSS